MTSTTDLTVNGTKLTRALLDIGQYCCNKDPAYEAFVYLHLTVQRYNVIALYKFRLQASILQPKEATPVTQQH